MPGNPRKCGQCRKEKPISEFYEREKNVRWDSFCIECRKAVRRSRYHNKYKNSSLDEATKNVRKSNKTLPDRVIEREDTHHIDDFFLNKCYNKKNNSIDFSNWEKSYNQALTEKDRLEITNSIINFTFLLADELNMKTSAYVDLSKKNK